MLEALNRTSLSAERLRERAAMGARGFDWIGSGGIAVAEKTIDNMVIKPLDAFKTAPVDRNAGIMGEEFADLETTISVESAKALGSGLVRITRRAIDATTIGWTWPGSSPGTA